MGILWPQRYELPEASRMEVQSIGKVTYKGHIQSIAKLTDIFWFSHMF